jgi:ArsR family transcriptional regulator
MNIYIIKGSGQMVNSYAAFVPVFKALADETRLEIIAMLTAGELCACKILEEFRITQPTLSYHMKILTESGLVNGVREGAWMRYSLNEATAKEVKLFLDQLYKMGSTNKE